MLVVVCCVLSFVDVLICGRCLLFVVGCRCCLLFVVCRLLFVRVLFNVCWLLPVCYIWLIVGCCICLSFLVCCELLLYVV